MTDDTDDTTRRLVRHTACFTVPENAVLMTKVEVAGISISSLLRRSVLEFSQQRIMRRPTVDQQLAAHLLAELGDVATAFRQAAALVDPDAVRVTMDDLAEYRLFLLECMGRDP